MWRSWRGVRVASGVLLVLQTAACAGDGAGGSGDDDDGGPRDPDGPPALSPTRALARTIDRYLVNYGSWDADEVAIAQQHQLVILNPNREGVTRELVASIQGGRGGAGATDPSQRVLVACYVSIGEDYRTVHLSDDELRADPRFVGDGTGPRMDPRGPDADGAPLDGLDPRGVPSNGGTGFASYYLDDNSVHESPTHTGDGRPDRNGNFHGAFTNVGDPAWFDVLQDMTFDGDGAAGLREALTTTYGRGLGCDGVFLDTIDTMAPNSFTDPGDRNRSKYEWTAPGYPAFVERLRAAYPDIVVVQNRGVFFFNPAHPHYAFIPRGQLDFVMFESYRLNSAPADNPHPFYYPDNRYNFAPRLMAEASRADGFRVLSLGYAEGPPGQMDERTLVGGSTVGLDSLLEDIRVTEREAGFRHYLTDASVTLVNRFVTDHADRTDDAPPVWTSTYNDHDHRSGGAPPAAPTPRVGVQEVEGAPRSLVVRWDVALDLHGVSYAIYVQPAPFDFAGDPALSGATRVVAVPVPSAAYTMGVGPHAFANEAIVDGLEPGVTYHVVVRAFDHAAPSHEDDNQVELTGTPTP